MTDDVIVKNEVLNDGGTVHMYYNNVYQGYVAYGFSAYIAGVVEPRVKDGVRPHFSYSEAMQMPFLVIKDEDLRSLQSRMVTEETGKGYICLHGVSVLDEEKYGEWASFLRGE